MAASALLLEKASKVSEHRLLLLMLLLLWWWASTIINVFCRRYPIYLIKVLTSFHLGVRFIFVAFLFCFSLQKIKNSFFQSCSSPTSEIQLLPSFLPFLCSHPPSAKYTTKTTFLFILLLFFFDRPILYHYFISIQPRVSRKLKEVLLFILY